MLGANFTFIERTVLRPGVLPAAPEFRTGCDCPDAEDCLYDSCKCLDEVDVDAEDDDQLDDDEREIIEWVEHTKKQQERVRQRGSRHGSRDVGGPGPASSRAAQASRAAAAPNGDRRSKNRFAYHSKGAKAGLLRGSQLDSPAAIYECHEGCHCDKASCPNRIVERGRQVPLQIFRTEDGRGWGTWFLPRPSPPPSPRRVAVW